MLEIAPHSAADYAALSNIDDPNVATLSTDDQVCLNELGRCLCDTKQQKRFSIVLLHAHFPIDHGERMFEAVCAASGAEITTPISTTAVPSDCAAHLVCFDSFAVTPRVIGLEYSNIETEQQISETDTGLLTMLHDILARHKKKDRFGLKLRHRVLDNFDERVFLEFCDFERRILTARLVDRLSTSGSTATEWAWEEGFNQVARLCVTYCSMAGLYHHPSHEGEHG